MSAPWKAQALTMQQPYRYFVCRPDGAGGWEQLRTDYGGCAVFETMAQAQRAADTANAAQKPAITTTGA